MTRYTKALEVIKKLHKDQAHEIKTYKLKLENLQTLKDAAYKVLVHVFDSRILMSNPPIYGDIDGYFHSCIEPLFSLLLLNSGTQPLATRSFVVL